MDDVMKHINTISIAKGNYYLSCCREIAISLFLISASSKLDDGQ